MVIQSNMRPVDLRRIWPETESVLVRYGISPASQQIIEEEVPEDQVPRLFRDLNEAVGSSIATCTAGG